MSNAKKSQALREDIIRLLQEEREKRGITKYAVAQKSGLSPQMISYVERGIRNPTLETVLRMAEAIDIDLASVIKKARSRSKPNLR